MPGWKGACRNRLREEPYHRLVLVRTETLGDPILAKSRAFLYILRAVVNELSENV